MNCKLVAISQPVIAECETAEDLVAYCARVSNPANQANKLTAAKLLKFLADNHHWSPFEMVSLTIEIPTTRDIGRQILRHRSFAFQEFSQRYAEVIDFSEAREARLQDHKNRQNSIEINDSGLQVWWEDAQDELMDQAACLYRSALDKGLAKEVARAVLPEGLTMSRMYMAGTLRSWIHYCQLRMGNGTQKEHAKIARSCWAIIVEQFPSLKGIVERDEYDDMVDALAYAMKAKLRKKDAEGYSGWDTIDDELLEDLLLEHVQKGDPVDIANFAAFKYTREQNAN